MTKSSGSNGMIEYRDRIDGINVKFQTPKPCAAEDAMMVLRHQANKIRASIDRTLASGKRTFARSKAECFGIGRLSIPVRIAR